MSSTPLWVKALTAIVMLPMVLIVGIITVWVIIALLTKAQGVTF